MMKKISSIEKYNLFLGFGGLILGIAVIAFAILWPPHIGADPDDIYFLMVSLVRLFIGLGGICAIIYGALQLDDTINEILEPRNE